MSTYYVHFKYNLHSSIKNRIQSGNTKKVPGTLRVVKEGMTLKSRLPGTGRRGPLEGPGIFSAEGAAWLSQAFHHSYIFSPSASAFTASASTSRTSSLEMLLKYSLYHSFCTMSCMISLLPTQIMESLMSRTIRSRG